MKRATPPPELRDAAALAALQGLLAHPDTHQVFDSFQEIADQAYRYADAMLIARNHKAESP